ncbi:unnamed protein product [Clavelina lepadiformis]|uniref:Hexosyltransferase n=1 Tax=Clavelina lepadiformis TaxID=159417 RepID=A0ABP0G9M6_CLALP
MNMKRNCLYFMFIPACLCCAVLIIFCGQDTTRQSSDEEDTLRKLININCPINVNEIADVRRSTIQPRSNHGIEFLLQPHIEFRRKHYTTSNDTTCKDKKPSWAMVTFVKSTAGNIDRRNLLRRTWASLGKIDRSNFYTVFIIGKPADKLQENIRAEFRKYRDILQINNPEDYQIIGLKTLAGMKWASENLPFNYYYSTSDDDMWIDMLKVKEMIDQYRMVVMEDDWPEFPIICTYKWWRGSVSPLRMPQDKNFIPRQKYRWPYWPTFCFGGMYTTSVNVIKQLWELSTVTEPLYNADDVWITGLLRNKLEMPDEMVIRPEEHAAKHYRGFENEDGTVKYEVKFDEWNETLKKVQSRGLCRW